MTTDPAALLFRWLSPSYPIGAFAYSHGLEAAIAEGRVSDAHGLQAWLTDVLARGAGRNDAILLAAAFHAGEGDLPELAELALALCPSEGRRRETLLQGAAFAEVTANVHSFDLPAMAYPLALGRAACLMDLPLPLTLRLFLQSFAGTLVSAAVRLVPLGQTDGQRVLDALALLCDRLATEAAPGDIDRLGGAAILSDIMAMRQETLATRLFRS